MIVTQQMQIAELIREMRRRLGLSQEKFAHQLGVTCLTVNRWENGRAKPSPLAMEKIEGMLRGMGAPGQDLLKKQFSEQ